MGCLVRYSTYSTYSKDPWGSGCSVGYSTYSMELGESGCSVGCLVKKIAHIAHIARTRGRVEVQRVGVHIAHIAHIAWSWGRVEPNPGTFVRFCATKCYSSRVYMYVRPVRIARFARFCATKCYYYSPYMYVHPGVIAFLHGFAPQNCYSYSAYINVGTRGIAFARVLHGLPMPALI